MNIKLRKSQLRTLKSNDPRFHIVDGSVTAQRAGFEISNQCPEEYKAIFITCVMHGWIKPVATVTERELLFMGLTKDE
jgi:hypothetical protein